MARLFMVFMMAAIRRWVGVGLAATIMN